MLHFINISDGVITGRFPKLKGAPDSTPLYSISIKFELVPTLGPLSPLLLSIRGSVRKKSAR
jgi:hypothetical protein